MLLVWHGIFYHMHQIGQISFVYCYKVGKIFVLSPNSCRLASINKITVTLLQFSKICAILS